MRVTRARPSCDSFNRLGISSTRIGKVHGFLDLRHFGTGIGSHLGFGSGIGIDHLEHACNVFAQSAQIGIDEADGIVDFMRHTGGQLADGGHFFRLQQLVLRGFELFIELFQLRIVRQQLPIGLFHGRGSLLHTLLQLIVQRAQRLLLRFQFLVFLHHLQRLVAQLAIHFVQGIHQHVRRLGHERGRLPDGFLVTVACLQRQEFLRHALVQSQNMLHQPVGQIFQQRRHELFGNVGTGQQNLCRLRHLRGEMLMRLDMDSLVGSIDLVMLHQFFFGIEMVYRVICQLSPG